MIKFEKSIHLNATTILEHLSFYGGKVHVHGLEVG